MFAGWAGRSARGIRGVQAVRGAPGPPFAESWNAKEGDPPYIAMRAQPVREGSIGGRLSNSRPSST